MHIYLTNHENPIAIQWYKKLDVNRKIYIKEMFPVLCGVSFEDARELFTLKEIISIFYNKLVAEGVIPPR